MKKGFSGPSMCPLCCTEEESVSHLMISCSFTVQVWDYLKDFLNIDAVWHGQNVEQAFRIWFDAGKNWRSIPFYVCRSIWLARNSHIFKGLIYSPLQIFNKVQNAWLDRADHSRVIRYRYLQQPFFQQNVAIGYFDGA